MRADRDSFRKTVVLGSGGAVVMLGALAAIEATAGGPIGTAARGSLLVVAGLLLLSFVTVAVSGLLVIHRDRRSERGEQDLFEWLNEARSEQRLASQPPSGRRPLPLAFLRRRLGGFRFLVGDRVRVKSLPEILATLDSQARLDALPFMPEMARFCGQPATVFRCIDKIYDYGGRKDMRRMDDCVTLVGLRCSGDAHGGCQTACSLIWKTAWLESLRGAECAETRDDNVVWLSEQLARLRRLALRPQPETYTCQFTELVRATSAMSPRDVRQDLRPLIAGNVTFRAYLVAMLSRLFNIVQGKRGGVGYLTVRPAAAGPSPPRDLGLREGEAVIVRPAAEIAGSLDRNGRHRGLWFDRDMLKHCGRTYRVARVVERLVDDATGRMLTMKVPCIVLERVVASGEFMRFCPQHDDPFWREAWLSRAEVAGDGLHRERRHA